MILQDKLDEANVTIQDLRKNFKWIILKYIKEDIRLIEDILTVVVDLMILEMIKKPKIRKEIERKEGGSFPFATDINKYKNATGLATDMKVATDILIEPEPKLSIEELEKLGELEIIYKDGKWIAFELKTARACADTGSDAWCTTRWAFDDYRSEGKLYTVQRKNSDTEMYHFHFERGEFTDENNDQLESYHLDELPLDKIFPWSPFNAKNKKQQVELLVNAAKSREDDSEEVFYKVGDLIDAFHIPEDVVAEFLEEYPNIGFYFSTDYLTDEMKTAMVKSDPMPLISWIGGGKDPIKGGPPKFYPDSPNEWSEFIEENNFMKNLLHERSSMGDCVDI